MATAPVTWPSAPAGSWQSQAKFYEDFAAKYYPHVWSTVRKPPKGITYPYPQYDGLTYAQIVTRIHGQVPQTGAEDVVKGVAQQYLDDLGASGILTGAAGAAGTAGTATGATATGIESTSFLPAWAVPFADFLGALESGALWLRALKIAVGSALLIIGAVKITGAGPAIAKTAVKAAPFL